MCDNLLVGPIRIRIIQERKRFLRNPIKEHIHLELEVMADDTVKIRSVKGNVEEVHADIERGFGFSGAGIHITNLNLEDYTISGNYSPTSGPLDMWIRSSNQTAKVVTK